MIIYLTYNDQPSGVYWSQVTDVVAHLNKLGPAKVRLVALVSIRNFRHTKARIQQRSPTALVIPMVPTMKRWRSNSLLVNWVCRKLKPSGIIARGVMATHFAQKARDKGLVRKVCFDGRGAYAAEWEEYRIIDDQQLIDQFRPLEQAAVNQSDQLSAISEALVQYWRERYAYDGTEHVVIPCTLGNDHGKVDLSTNANEGSTGNSERPIRLVYSGSTAGWQSFQLLETLLTKILDLQPEVHVLFLSKEDDNNRALIQRYPGRVEVRWLQPHEVQATLAGCDHGILVREHTVTNRVASPTKFAEYLAAGLPVIISEHLGDFTALVEQHHLGVVLRKGHEFPSTAATDKARKHALMAFAQQNFTKDAFNHQYRQVIEALG